MTQIETPLVGNFCWIHQHWWSVSNIWNIDIARVFMRYVDVDTVMGLEAVMVTTIWSGLE